mmetsp:Transcript_11362/g.26747  ORF Transcript_11362/g.26747 Transcript_11362/m.26747 type:complete len:407 (-) Transcript_11362:760-1980(-)
MHVLRDVGGEVDSHVADLPDRRVHCAVVETLLPHLLGQRLGADQQAAFVDLGRARGERREAEAREDEGVVALARLQLAPVDRDAFHRAPRREDHLPVGPRVGLRGRALRLGRRVREREDQRRCHRGVRHQRCDHWLVEGLELPADPDQACRFYLSHCLCQLCRRLRHALGEGVSEGLLVVHEVRAPRVHQPLGVHQPDALPRLLERHLALLSDGGGEEVGDPAPCLPGPVEQEGVVDQAKSCERLAGEHTRECGGSGALDVVVEARGLILVLIQKLERVPVPEVLELDQHRVAILLLGSVDDLAHELIIRRAALTRLPQTHVTHIVPQRLVVGADVDMHREAVPRMHASTRRVQRQLPDCNPHPVHPQVTEPEDPLPVCHHNDLDIVLWPVFQGLLHVSNVVRAEV